MYLQIINQIPKSIKLIAVSKFQSIEAIQDLYDQNHLDFGENYIQELENKQNQLPQQIRWHFIGHLQSNKIPKLLDLNIYLFQSLDSIELAQKLNSHMEKINYINYYTNQNQLPVLLQINISNDKQGFELNQIKNNLKIINDSYKYIDVKGFMCLNKIGDQKQMIDMQNMCNYMIKIYKKQYILSMGTSQDYNQAIQNGSDMVRLGTILFGERQKE